MSVRKRKWVTAKGEEKEAWIVDYVDHKKKRHLKTFERKKDADAFRDAMRTEVRQGIHVAARDTITVAEAGENWLKRCEADGLEKATVEAYRQHLVNHICDGQIGLGGVKLSDLSIPVVRQFQDRLRRGARSDSMVRRVTTSLGGLLAEAQSSGQVARNVVRDMARTRSQLKPEDRHEEPARVGVDIPAPAEISAILKHAEGRWRPLLVTAVYTGLRASELRGLRWADVDLEESRLHVRQRADRFNEIGSPKSPSSRRTIPFGPGVQKTLREWKLACPLGKLDLVFPNGAGNIEAHGNIINRGLIPAQIAAGVTAPALDDDGNPKLDEKGQPVLGAKYTGLHSLRHFFASWCINRERDGGRELPIKRVQALLGHSTLMMTMDTYGHLFPDNDDGDALARAEQRLMSAVNAT